MWSSGNCLLYVLCNFATIFDYAIYLAKLQQTLLTLLLQSHNFNSAYDFWLYVGAKMVMNDLSLLCNWKPSLQIKPCKAARNIYNLFFNPLRLRSHYNPYEEDTHDVAKQPSPHYHMFTTLHSFLFPILAMLHPVKIFLLMALQLEENANFEPHRSYEETNLMLSHQLQLKCPKAFKNLWSCETCFSLQSAVSALSHNDNIAA